MANFLREFNTHDEYTTFTASTEYVMPNVSTCIDGGDVHYNPFEPQHDYSQDYFTTVAKSSGTITFSGSSTANTLSYSKDNGSTWSTAAQEPSVTVNAGVKVLWKGTCRPNSYHGIGNFTTEEGSATFDVEGNVMSLLYGDNFKGQTSLYGITYAFCGLFTGNAKVISAENLSLPATTLAADCYAEMFTGCTSLTTAPSILPATTLTEYCYSNMFAGCTSLITAPELPANTLVMGSYNRMFSGCTSLNSITCLATDKSAGSSTANWVSGVAVTGTFTKNPNMTNWPTGVNGIPSGWSVQDA